MKTVILAGGLGTRLRSLFPNLPKPMVPVKGKPFLEYQLSLLAAQGFTDFILCVGYLADQIKDYFQEGQAWNWKINYAIEESLLGTAGAILNAAAHLQETFLVLNGDTYFATDYQALVQRHQALSFQHEILATIALTKIANSSAYGSIQLASDGQILQFTEKVATITPTWINAGAYVMEPAILSYITPQRAISIEREIFPQLAGKGLYGYPAIGSFIDMGTPNGYQSLFKALTDR